MAPAAASPLLKLFGTDRAGPGLQHVRDKIYSHLWSRERRDDHKLDFVVSENGVNRNVPERLVDGEDVYGDFRPPRMPPPACSLQLVNKQISKDFSRYIYTTNDLEVDIDLKELQTDACQAALKKFAALLRNPNFQKYTSRVRIRIHFPSKYPIAGLPAFNQSALNSISSALDEFKNLAHVAIRVVPVQGALLDYELRLAAFPFYPMRMTNWTIHALNTAIKPYQYDLVDDHTIDLLAKAYAEYRRTGNLTAPIPAPVNKKPLQANKTAPNKNSKVTTALDSVTSKNPSVTVNGSQKKRQGKKNKASKAAEGTHQDVAPVEPVKENAKENAKDELPTVKILPVQKSPVQKSLPSSAGSAPVTPAQNQEMTQVPSSCTSTEAVVPLPVTTSVIDNLAPDDADNTAAECIEPKHPEADNLAADSAKDDNHAVDNTLGETSVLDNVRDTKNTAVSGAKKRRQSKKSKRNKNKKTATESRHDSNSEVEVEFKVDEIEEIQREEPQVMYTYNPATETYILDNDRVRSFNHDVLSRGQWEPFPEIDSIVIFNHPDTHTRDIVAKSKRLNRYIRQQDRRDAAALEESTISPKPLKVVSKRKARQIMLARGRVDADSPLSHAMRPTRPRDAVKEQTASETSSSPTDVSHERVLEVKYLKTSTDDEDSIESQQNMRRKITQSSHIIDCPSSDSDDGGSVTSSDGTLDLPMPLLRPENGTNPVQGSSGLTEDFASSPEASTEPATYNTSSVAGQLDSVGSNNPPEDVHSGRRERGRGRGLNWVRGRGRGQSNGRENYTYGKENYGPVRGSYQGDHRRGRGNYRGGRDPVPEIVRPRVLPKTQQASKWATFAQSGSIDNEFNAARMERQRAMEQDMAAKGKTYEDYDSRVEDNFIKVDDDRNPVTDKTEKILYGPQSRCVVQGGATAVPEKDAHATT